MGDGFEALDGGCNCGAVRYRMERAPIITHACHCRFCQRMSGAAFSLNAMIEAEHVPLTGAATPEVIVTKSALPEGQRVHRCAECGLALWTNHAQLGERIVLINVGTLDRSEAIAPDVHCYTATKHPWIAVPAGMPAYPGEYDNAQVWSEEAQARLSAALGGD